MCNKYNIFNNVSNMCPVLHRYLKREIHIFDWNIEKKFNKQEKYKELRQGK